MGVPEQLAERMSMAEQHEYLRSKFSRRGLFRGGVVAAGAVATASTVAGTAAAQTGATANPAFFGRPGSGAVGGSLVAPYGRHLAFGADPSTEFRIAWQTPVAVSKPFVRFGRSPLSLSHKIEAETRALHTPALFAGAVAVDQFYHHVALDHLEPETTYFYGVGHSGFDPADVQNLGTLGTFTTGPRTGRHARAPKCSRACGARPYSLRASSITSCSSLRSLFAKGRATRTVRSKRRRLPE